MTRLFEGETVIYRIDLANTGMAAATNVRFVVSLPPNLELVRVLGPNFRQDGQRVVSQPQSRRPRQQAPVAHPCQTQAAKAK